MAASDFAPGQTRRVDKRSKTLSCPPRAKQPFIARWLGRVKPTEGGFELPLFGGVEVSIFWSFAGLFSPAVTDLLDQIRQGQLARAKPLQNRTPGFGLSPPAGSGFGGEPKKVPPAKIVSMACTSL